MSKTLLKQSLRKASLDESRLRGEVERGASRPQQDSCRGGLSLPSGGVIVGAHARMRELFRSIRRLAARDVTVLVSGETGTGKELVARALHELSSRGRERFVAVNSAALPPALAENELFGHREGSFTGASRSRAGLVEAARGGTLFLDEVSSMPMELQSRLLRVLEERAVRRLGEAREREVDFRVVAATNQPLGRLVSEGRFRQDLFHRLNVVEIRLPALRERRSDLMLLVEHFLGRLEGSNGESKRLSPNSVKLLGAYSFPGNVRELRNLIESGYHLSEGEWIRARHLPQRLEAPNPGIGAGVDTLFQRLIDGRAEFWRDVRDCFLARDLCRDQLRALIALGLERSEGNYRRLIQLFNLPSSDYHRFLGFLGHHDCKVDFRRYRKGA